jgi:shikimate 5-dehydrogenase
MKFGLIGYPIEHSLSPALFKAGYGGLYPYDLIITEDFKEAYRRFLEGYDGINVTAPFKELALRKADIVSEECRLVGATNLLIKTPEGIAAYNSDFRGLIAIFKGLKGNEKTVLIVGAGGAGKAAKAAAEAMGYETTVINRTQYSPEIKPLSSFTEEFKKADIVIYNLPVRIPEIDMLTKADLCPGKEKVILEANYRNPSFDNGSIQRMVTMNPLIRYIDGREWLLQQAVTGYELFTGKTPDCKAMKATIKSK